MVKLIYISILGDKGEKPYLRYTHTHTPLCVEQNHDSKLRSISLRFCYFNLTKWEKSVLVWTAHAFGFRRQHRGILHTALTELLSWLQGCSHTLDTATEHTQFFSSLGHIQFGYWHVISVCKILNCFIWHGSRVLGRRHLTNWFCSLETGVMWLNWGAKFIKYIQ